MKYFLKKNLTEPFLMQCCVVDQVIHTLRLVDYHNNINIRPRPMTVKALSHTPSLYI